MAYFICLTPGFSDMLVSAPSQESAVEAFAFAAVAEKETVECEEVDPTPAFLKACQALGTFLEVTP